MPWADDASVQHIPHYTSTSTKAPTVLAAFSVLLGGLLTLAWVLMFVTSFHAAEQYADYGRRGVDAMAVPLMAFDLIAIVPLLLLVPVYVVSALFLHRARDRAEARTPWHHARSKVWVWLGWWVPVVSAWFPFQVVRDIVGNATGRRGAGPHLGVWWGAWLVCMVMNQVGSRLIPFTGPATPEAAVLLPYATGLSAAAAVVAYVYWVRIVRTITGALKASAATA